MRLELIPAHIRQQSGQTAAIKSTLHIKYGPNQKSHYPPNEIWGERKKVQ